MTNRRMVKPSDSHVEGARMEKQERIMVKLFTVTVDGATDELLLRAAESARTSGADFHGDGVSGELEGHGMKGEYRVEGSEVLITIMRKPLVVSWSHVESVVRRFFTREQ
jgi:hypothetical protein